MRDPVKRVPHSRSLFSRHREQKHRLQGPGLALHRLSVCGLFENPGNVTFSIRCIQNACAAAAFVQKSRSHERLVIVTANQLGCCILISYTVVYEPTHRIITTSSSGGLPQVSPRPARCLAALCMWRRTPCIGVVLFVVCCCWGACEEKRPVGHMSKRKTPKRHR